MHPQNEANIQTAPFAGLTGSELDRIRSLLIYEDAHKGEAYEIPVEEFFANIEVNTRLAIAGRLAADGYYLGTYRGGIYRLEVLLPPQSKTSGSALSVN